MMMKMMKMNDCSGLSIKMMNAEGMTPMNAPKMGMTAVTPTSVLTSGA